MNEELEDLTSGLDEGALVARLRSAELASTDEFGNVNHTWLVLHLWLAQCDMVRSDQLTRNVKIASSENLSVSSLNGYKHLFRRVLPATLPLMHEFTDPEMFRLWREAGFFEGPANDRRFLDCAFAAGLPITAEDLIYALGSAGPYGKEVYYSVAKHVQSSRAH